MSALTTTLPTSARPLPDAPMGVPFRRLLAVEVRKLVDTRAGLWLLVVIGLITAAGIAIVLLTASPAGLTFSRLAFAAAVPQSLLLPVLGILTATSEWSQRTGLITFTLEPRRLRVGAAKLTASLLVALGAVGVALAVGALANLAGILWLDGVGTWRIGPEPLLGGILMQLLSVAQGVTFGAAIGNTAAAIVAIFVLPTAWLAASVLSPSIERMSQWADLGVTSAPLTGGAMTAADWGPLAVSVGVWVLLPLVVGGWRLQRREVV